MKSSAAFSQNRRYRYSLLRIWDPSKPLLHICALNPSTADEVKNDPTIRREIRFASDMGFGGLIATNIFAFRATDPRKMKEQRAPVGSGNDSSILEASKSCQMSIAAWGVHGAHLGRHQEMLNLPVNWHCFGSTKDGYPRHPLYLPKWIRPFKLRRNHESETIRR